MSITVPANLNTNIANRSENWIVQLFNSSKTDSGANTSGSLYQNQTSVNVTSGAAFNVADIISFGSGTELCKVTAINSNTLTLQRRFMGTSATSSVASGSDVHKRNYVGLSYSSITFQGQFFEPCILNKASIRESIDLENQTSARSNVSIKIANFDYQGAPFSEQLHNGSNVYLNQLVRIYIPPAKMSSSIGIDDCLQIYEGRLVNTAHDDTSITLEINTDEPWKDVIIPDVKHDKYDVYQPVVYGDYTHSDATNGASNDAAFGTVFPVPVLYTNRNVFSCVLPKAYGSGSNSYMHHYVGFNWFCSIKEEDTGIVDTTTTDGGVHVLETPITHRATGLIRSANAAYSASDGGSVTYLNNPERAFTYNAATGAADTSTFASINISSISSPRYLVVQTPNKQFAVTIIKQIRLKHDVFLTDRSGTSQLYDLDFFSNNYDSTLDDLVINQPRKTLADNNISTDYVEFTAQPANAVNSINAAVCPDEILIKYIPITGPPTNIFEAHTLRVYDVQLEIKVHFNHNDDDAKRLADLQYFYCGGDGLHDTQVGGVHWISGGGSSTNITNLPQMHRDLLHRFTHIELAPENYSDLNTQHNWEARFWQLDRKSLSDILKKIQSEGQFIFRLKSDNTPQYVFLKTNPIADHIITKQDISSLQISDTDFRSIATKYIFNFHKHPAESSKYYQTTEISDSTARDLYGISNTKDNTKTIDLDYLVDDVTAGSGYNASYHNYKKQLFGTVKTILKCKIVNPEFYNMDVGDIVALEDMHIKAYNVDYSNTAYMITSVQRKLGEMDIELREVADSLATTWGPIVVNTGGEGVIHNVQNNFTMVNNHWKCKTMSIELFNDTLGFNQVISSSTAINFSTNTQQFNYTPDIDLAHARYQIRCRCNETGEVAESSIFSIALS